MYVLVIARRVLVADLRFTGGKKKWYNISRK